MNLLTLSAIDMHSSEQYIRTFSTNDALTFKQDVENFEKELPFRRYELMCNELISDYSDEIIEVLDELEVTY